LTKRIIKPTRHVNEDGTIEWRLNGQFHRHDGPARIRKKDGIEMWYFMGKLHRVDGPAEIVPGKYKAWYKFGKSHREDGPAFEFENGNHVSYFLEGKRMSEEEYLTTNPSKYPKLQVYQIMHA
jgi:hypothetical protein